MPNQSAHHTSRKHKSHNVSPSKQWHKLYDRRWRRFRTVFLMEHPLCECDECKGKVRPAEVVDHIIPHRGNKELFWREGNHQALSKVCHDRKTARETLGRGG